MRVVNKDEVALNEALYSRYFSRSLFVYPTDTVYGIGCNACDEALVARLREVKGQHRRPFSVIAPSVEWIKKNCVLTKEAMQWLARLPGPYTLILPLKNPDAVAWNVNMGMDSIGVRLPDCWVSEVVSKLGVPIVTTSANLVGGDVMVKLDDLHPELKSNIDFIIYEGSIRGTPSTLVYLERELAKIEER